MAVRCYMFTLSGGTRPPEPVICNSVDLILKSYCNGPFLTCTAGTVAACSDVGG